MRKPSACAACRSRRRKCKTKEGHIICQYCRERGLHCDFSPPQGGYYAQRAQRLTLAVHAQTGCSSDHGNELSVLDRDRGQARHPSTVSHTALPGLALRLDLVRLYFDYTHDQMHSLFHKPTFIEDVLNDRVPAGILYGIIALSARFSTDPNFADIDPRDRGDHYLRESEALLNLRDTSLTTMQHCVLLGACLTASGHPQAENVYYAIACRMAQLLDLPNRATESAVETETNLRVWWSLVMIDVWSSTGVRLPRMMPIRQGLPLPMDDLAYISMTPDGNHDSPSRASFSRGSQLLAEQCKLNRILEAVNTFNHQCVIENPSWDILETGVETLAARLDDWYDTLPATLRDTPENLSWFASRGLGRVFAAVYLGYYNFGQLLYYQFLHGASSELESSHASGTSHHPASSLPSASSRTLATTHIKREVYARRCKDHAGHLCEMVYRSHATADADVRYFMTSHVLVIASTVQIHTLLFSAEEDDIAVARQRLERNFELLLRLQVYWPPVDRAISRLRAFHATARTSVGSSFVLDRWMLRFLVEFAETMEEREADGWRSGSEEMESLWNR